MSGPFPGAVWRVACIVPKHAVDAVADALELLGGAVTEFVPDEKSPEVRLECYLAEEPDGEAVRNLVAGAAATANIASPGLEITWLAPRDWVAENRRAFEPFSVGRFFVHGSDFTGAVPLGATALEVDAGLAFGSGRHESTAGCLRALDRLTGKSFRRVLDMGCGSGILAIAAAKTWRVPVIAADVDPSAVRVARINARANGVGALVRTTAGNGFAAARVRRYRPYDLIAANILAAPLCGMAQQLGRHLKPGGYAVLAGFVVADGNRLLAAYRAAGLRPVRHYDVNGWRTLVLRKPRRI